MRLSIIIPTLDEAGTIGELLHDLALFRAGGVEVIVVDGGSTDGTPARATDAADRVLRAPRGRAAQLNAGAAVASGDLLWFLHADTRVPSQAVGALRQACAAGASWGRFDVCLSGRHPLLRLVEVGMNVRSRLTGIATGDQGIFVTRALLERVGGFPPIALMEDIALSAALRRITRPTCLRVRLTTSSRRWEADGAVRTILLMWRLRSAYSLGADPIQLARAYGPGHRRRSSPFTCGCRHDSSYSRIILPRRSPTVLPLLDRLSLGLILILVLTLGLAPFAPEPHIWEKLKMLAASDLVRPIDIFDLILHGIPWLLLFAKLGRMATARRG